MHVERDTGAWQSACGVGSIADPVCRAQRPRHVMRVDPVLMTVVVDGDVGLLHDPGQHVEVESMHAFPTVLVGERVASTLDDRVGDGFVSGSLFDAIDIGDAYIHGYDSVGSSEQREPGSLEL